MELPDLPRHQHALTDSAFLDEFDTTLPGLKSVAEALNADDLPAAKQALVDYMKTRSAPRWVFDARAGYTPEQMLFHLWPPSIVTDHDATTARADLLFSNQFPITDGVVLDFGPDLDWVTPATQSLTVPGNAFKCCHWLRDLNWAWLLTGKAKYAEKWADLIEHWIEDFALFLEDGFTGEEMVFNREFGEKSMPTGQRLFSWLTCLYTGIPFAPEVPTDTAFAFIKAIWYNGAAYQHFEASPFHQHNHHIMRTVNVPACMALAFPETPRFQGLLAMARDRMAQHARKSFLADGGYAERTSSYSQVTVGMFMAPLALARLNGVQLADAETTEHLRRAVDFLASTVLPDGTLPPSGDGKSTDLPSNAASMYLATLAVDSSVARAALQRTGLAAVIPKGTMLEAVATMPPKHCHYPTWGIAVLRTGWSPDASALTMNIPDGANQNHSHAHDDALACSIVIRGRSIIAVPADELYIYVHDPQWSDTPHYGYLRSSLGKNVVLPGGKVRRDPYVKQESWTADTPPVTSSLTETAEGAVLKACAQVCDCDWHRTVMLEGETWTVEDSLTRLSTNNPAAPHVLQWHFQYGVEVVANDSGSGFVASTGDMRVRLVIDCDSPWSFELIRNADWLKPNAGRAGVIAPWLLRISFGAGAGTAEITTRIYSDG